MRPCPGLAREGPGPPLWIAAPAAPDLLGGDGIFNTGNLTRLYHNIENRVPSKLTFAIYLRVFRICYHGKT